MNRTRHMAEGQHGFAEDLTAIREMEKLLGRNFIDDRQMLESEGVDPAEGLRAKLQSMDAGAASIRKGLNTLVKEGIGMTVEAQQVDLGEGSDVLASFKGSLEKLLTAYTEVVSKLQKARNTLGYEMDGPSVTSNAEDEVQEQRVRRFSKGNTRVDMPREVTPLSEQLFQGLTERHKNPTTRVYHGGCVVDALESLANAVSDRLNGTPAKEVRTQAEQAYGTLHTALKKLPESLRVPSSKEGVRNLRTTANELRNLLRSI